MKPSANLSLLFNQFNNFSPEQKNEPKNVVNSDYYDIDHQTLKFHEKNKPLCLFHINACALSKTFDDLEHLLKCTNKVFDIVAVSETRITGKASLTSNINLQNYYLELTLTESNAGGTLLYIANHLSHKPYTDLKGTLSDLRQFLATESPLKVMKMLFISPQKLFLFSRYLSFYLDFFFMYQSGLIKKIRLISNFMTPQPG